MHGLHVPLQQIIADSIFMPGLNGHQRPLHVGPVKPVDQINQRILLVKARNVHDVFGFSKQGTRLIGAGFTAHNCPQVDFRGNNGTTCRDAPQQLFIYGKPAVFCGTSQDDRNALDERTLQRGLGEGAKASERPKAKKRPRTNVAAAVASIVLVVAIAGVAAAAWWRQRQHAPPAVLSLDGNNPEVELAAHQNIDAARLPES
jgi:hypothetical protein